MLRSRVMSLLGRGVQKGVSMFWHIVAHPVFPVTSLWVLLSFVGR